MATRLTKDSTEVKGAVQGIVNLALEYGVGQWASRLCPECEGGSSRERSLSLNVQQNGIINYYCNRASCGFKGNTYISPAAASLGVKAPGAATRARPTLEDPISPLSEREKAFFLARYGIAHTDERIYRTESRYALPIFRPDGTRRGFITRRPYDGSPADTAANRNDPTWTTKTLTYLEGDEPCQSWYGHAPEGYTDAILVEDPLSAMRIIEFKPHWCAVAILGIRVSAEKIAEIQRKVDHIWIALDADATGQAFAMSRKWGSAFQSCRVIVLSKDIKDSTDQELGELPL